MQLSKLERETIFCFNEEEGFAEVETHNRKLRKRLEQLIHERPEEIKLVRQDEYSSVYQFPKSWIKINPSRILSAKDKEACRERAKLNLYCKKHDKNRGLLGLDN